jgi:phosphosulfolactate synthase (CoM biosynthesis protein A)
MDNKKSATQDIEKTLREIGDKIEELVKKGAEAGLEVKKEVEEKIQELKDNKTTLEKELKKGKAMVEREYRERSEDFKPKFEESKGLFLDGLKQIAKAIQTLLAKK